MDAQERQNTKKMIVQNHQKTNGFYCKNEDLEVSFWSCWVILGPCWCILGHHRAMMDQHGVIIAHLGSSLGLWVEKVAVARVFLFLFKNYS